MDDIDMNNDDKKRPIQSDSRIYTALSEFKGEQEGDLSVQVSYFLFFLQTQQLPVRNTGGFSHLQTSNCNKDTVSRIIINTYII